MSRIRLVLAGVASLKADAVLGQREVPLIEHEGMDHEALLGGGAANDFAALQIWRAVMDLFQ